MVFRFFAALALAVFVALIGTACEKQNLAWRRRISQQQYRLDLLTEQQSQLRLAVQQRGGPTRWLDPQEQRRLALQPEPVPRNVKRR